jgi:putative ABC transport system permease protein
MSLWQTLLTALRELSMHKFRSALAALGVIFGVASVMAMLSIGEGARRQSMERIAILGLDNVIVRTVKPPRMSEEAERGRSESEAAHYGILRRDVEYVRTVFPGLRRVVGSCNARREVRPTGGRPPLDLTVLATEPAYLEVTRSTLVSGRFLRASDGAERRMVCVLGVDAARKVFRFADPLGQWLRVGSDWFEVVGVLRNSANLKEAGGDDINNIVFVPLETVKSRYGDFSLQVSSGTYEVTNIELDSIVVEVEEDDAVAATARRLGNYLSNQHARRDYEVLVPRELMAQKEATQRIFTVVMGSIASISLLVGGIGIMNIMLANVSDRRREIGTRRALGARRLDIVRQFLLEAAALTTLGGAAGVALGYGLARGISAWVTWPVVIDPSSIVLGLAVSCASGVLFGFWPAWQAAKVNPIEALRAG